jgi:hypothetical protein
MHLDTRTASPASIGARRPGVTGNGMMAGAVVMVLKTDIDVGAAMTHVRIGRHTERTHGAPRLVEGDLGPQFPGSTGHLGDHRHRIESRA